MLRGGRKGDPYTKSGLGKKKNRPGRPPVKKKIGPDGPAEHIFEGFLPVPDGPVEHIFEGFLPVPDGPAENIFESFLPVPDGPAEHIFEGFSPVPDGACPPMLVLIFEQDFSIQFLSH